MSNARTIEERVEAAASSILNGGFNDSFRMAEAIEREFADVVETDSRVVALEEAVAAFLASSGHDHAPMPNCNLGQPVCDAYKLRAALKPLTEK